MKSHSYSRPDFMRGLKASLVPGVTFTAIFVGYSVAAMQKGLEPGLTFLFTLLVFASAAQYAVVDLIGSAMALWQLIAVGILVNVRFFVMGLTMSHFFRNVPLGRIVPWASFMAATPFLLSLFDKRSNRDADTFSFYCGVISVALPTACIGTVIGIIIQKELPPLMVFAAMLFLPVYFTILLVNDIRKRLEILTVVTAFFLTPVLEVAMPGWGIILSGGIVATVAVGIHKWTRQAE